MKHQSSSFVNSIFRKPKLIMFYFCTLCTQSSNGFVVGTMNVKKYRKIRLIYPGHIYGQRTHLPGFYLGGGLYSGGKTFQFAFC